ncbi:MAG: hypothetical protein OMM_03106 [Candidatus Magnetoglobus multicellularis str. Araruama]|uniref:ATP-binding protein n=1 Tax=Candidatus Magnetoglobus multicellularis str. Araruama TaxID=890399 RepID=A0A1V1P6W7_9BACT|nr:MAG: hypothetical protein OMM_03106 [Candidatus Magnetoglobus multicellularis str. Araruama]
MKKRFNTSGPCNSAKHFMLPTEKRCKGIMTLIDHEAYFVIHAARQSGKTTLIRDLVNKINKEGNYYALYCSLESAHKVKEPEKGIPGIVKIIKRYIGINPLFQNFSFAINADYDDYMNVLVSSLNSFSRDLDKPLVILFDEIDCLENGTLIAFLRQLRDGYINRDMAPFVHAIGLIGMRNIRDYKVKIREETETLGSASPFNIVKKSMTLKNFTEQEVQNLLSQHTIESGQKFSSNVVKSIYYFTQGQPWLVNAVACEIIEEILEYDYSKTIKTSYVNKAVQNITHRRDTHIDSLLERLNEKRVKKVMQPVLIGEIKVYNPLDDDFQYVIDLGLLKKEKSKLKISNPIYAEVVTRYLSHMAEDTIEDEQYPISTYFDNDRINMKKLLTDFQSFWRQNSAIWKEKYRYKEAAPHLVLMAFLQRVINSGGHIHRELSTETKRLDLCIEFKREKYPIELKLRYDKQTYTEGKKQIADYMDSLGCDEGWLIVFDQRKNISWKKRLFWRTATVRGLKIHTIGC